MTQNDLMPEQNDLMKGQIKKILKQNDLMMTQNELTMRQNALMKGQIKRVLE